MYVLCMGISAVNKVRKFNLERVFAEMEYCATKFPEQTSWIIADANFGMLKRDIEIALKLKEIKARNPALKDILIWESKNTNERNIEISKLLGNDLGNVLMAVQTLDPQSQKFTNRDNIHLDQVPNKIELFHGAGALIETHVLSGLPGESFDGHLETLRKCFGFGFDFISVFSTLLVKGSEMEFPESQKKYQIQTEHRLREGSYGMYRGIKSIESEEIVRSNSTISKEKMLALRPIHWLIWYGWNHGFLKPILKLLQTKYDHNPLEVILKIATADKSRHPVVKGLFEGFLEAAKSEWFETRKDFEDHYLQQETWDDLIENGYSKAEFIFNAKMILNRSTYDALIAYFFDILEQEVVLDDFEQVANILRASRIEPEKIFYSDVPVEQHFDASPEIANCFFPGSIIDSNETGGPFKICLKMPSADQERVRASLLKFKFEDDPLYAVHKTLGAHHNAFMYAVSVV